MNVHFRVSKNRDLQNSFTTDCLINGQRNYDNKSMEEGIKQFAAQAEIFAKLVIVAERLPQLKDAIDNSRIPLTIADAIDNVCEMLSIIFPDATINGITKKKYSNGKYTISYAGFTITVETYHTEK